MKQMVRFTILCAWVWVVSCGPSQTSSDVPETVDSRTLFLGTWENFTLKVNMPSYKGGATDSLMDIDTSNWKEKLQILPIRTTFSEDSTYFSSYRNLEGTEVYRPTGWWWVKGDTIFLQEGENPAQAYYFEIGPEEVRFEATMDWDQDTEVDDHYSGTQIRIK